MNRTIKTLGYLAGGFFGAALASVVVGSLLGLTTPSGQEARSEVVVARYYLKTITFSLLSLTTLVLRREIARSEE